MNTSLLLTILCIIVLDSWAWAQFTLEPRQRLTIIPSPHGAKYIDNLKQKFNLSQINFLDLVNLKKNNVDFLENSSLANFSALTHLNINSSEIVTLPDKALKGLSKLTYLNISFSDIQVIPADLLHYTPALQDLILSNNKFIELPPNMFQNISSLFNLDLHSNELVRLPEKVFHNLNVVFQLYLNGNKLGFLEPDVFHGLGSRLMTLNLSFNQIDFIDRQIFAKLGKLTKLSLVQAFSANITTLPSDIFSDLVNIQEIKLDENNLKYLPEDIFHQNQMLKTLGLANNQLTYLNDVIFKENTKLKSLYLNDNRLMILNKNVFTRLTELRELHLENNQLSMLDPSIFSQLTNLQSIWISNNSVNMAGPSTNLSNLYNCHNIVDIYANDNLITQIYDDWIQEDRQLNNLDLRSNPISGKNIVPSRFLSDHVTISLKERDAAEIKLKKLTLIEMDGSADRKVIMDRDPACGSNCSCVFDLDYKRSRMVLKCIRYNEKELQEKIPSFLVEFSATFNVELILSKCNLTSLYPLKGWLHQLNVTKLSLSDNQLSHLDGLPELPKLQVLELDNNKFTGIDKNTLEILTRATNLSMITLHNNPWICECSSQKFIDFFVSCNNSKKIMKADKITCDNLNQKPLLKIGPHDLCDGNKQQQLPRNESYSTFSGEENSLD